MSADQLSRRDTLAALAATAGALGSSLKHSRCCTDRLNAHPESGRWDRWHL
jgi:hypothetical protein